MTQSCQIIEEFLSKQENCAFIDLVNALKIVKEEDDSLYFDYLSKFTDDALGNLISFMPDFMLEDVLGIKSTKDIAKAIESLESDDATDALQNIEHIDEIKANEIFNHLNYEDQKDILFLKEYDENSVGAYMQTEFFSAKISDSVKEVIKKYRLLKHEMPHTYIQVFLTNSYGALEYCVNIGDLILLDFDKSFKDIIEENSTQLIQKAHFVYDYDDINEAIMKVEDYDLSVIGVVDKKQKLIGRITYDDIHDIIQDNATEQIYNLAGVGEGEDETSLKAAKGRAAWLLINLVTSLISANVIAIFSEEIEKLVALAAIMPIVASMGGNTGAQALAVTVRRLALGEIDFTDARRVIFREVGISFLNATIFAIILGVVSLVWFKMPLLGLVVFISMVLNLGFAGFIGSFIPLSLKRFGIDPAVGSNILLTATTDAIGFFSFLFLAKIILL